MNTTREHLLSLFQAAHNGVLSYEYRREQYRHDKTALAELIQAGLISQIDKNTRTVFYKITEHNRETGKNNMEVTR